MPQNQSLRNSDVLWALRAVQATLTLAIVAIAGTNALDWSDVDCKVPHPLQLNIAAAFITLPALLYLLSSTGSFKFQCVPWSLLLQGIIDLGLFSAWFFPATTRPYDCKAVCTSCATPANLEAASSEQGFFVWIGKLTCSCYNANKGDGKVHKFAVEVMRQTTAKLRPGKGLATTKIVSTAQRLAAKRGLNVAMAVLLAISLSVTILYMFQHERVIHRRQASSVSPSASFLGDPEKKGFRETVRPIRSNDSSPRSTSPPTPKTPKTPKTP